MSGVVAVYAGAEMNCVNLQLILAGNGIAVELEPRGAARLFAPASIVFVERADLERAAPLVEDSNRANKLHSRRWRLEPGSGNDHRIGPRYLSYQSSASRTTARKSFGT